MSVELELEQRVARGAMLVIPRRDAAARLEQVVSTPRHTLEDVVRVIRSCPLLTAATLRVANDPIHERPPTLQVLEAVARLGREELRRIAVGASLGAGAHYAGTLVAVRAAAQHEALLSALLCAALARRFGFDPETLFVVGLLHDVGTLVALGTLEGLLVEQDAPPRDVTDWLTLARRHHVELGLALAANWSLPAPLPEVIAGHHDADEDTLGWASLVRTSDRLLAHLKSGAPLAEARAPLLDRLRPDQRERFLRSLERLPAALDAMESDDKPFDSGIYRGASSYITATPAPPPLADRLGDVRLRQGHLARLTSASAQRLVLRAPVPLPENHLEALQLLVDGEPQSLWVRVVRSSLPDAVGEHVIEVVPFAPTRELLEHLERLAPGAHLEACA